jgi:hypothetical protein
VDPMWIKSGTGIHHLWNEKYSTFEWNLQNVNLPVGWDLWTFLWNECGSNFFQNFVDSRTVYSC